jgi:hypothetical protein
MIGDPRARRRARHRVNRPSSHLRPFPAGAALVGLGRSGACVARGLDSERLWRDGRTVRAPVNQLYFVTLPRLARWPWHPAGRLRRSSGGFNSRQLHSYRPAVPGAPPLSLLVPTGFVG